MSKSDLITAMTSIDSATPESPIAVFLLTDTHFDTLFAGTVHTMRRIRRGCPAHIGNFDSTMDRETVKHQLREAMRGRPNLIAPVAARLRA